MTTVSQDATIRFRHLTNRRRAGALAMLLVVGLAKPTDAAKKSKKRNAGKKRRGKSANRSANDVAQTAQKYKGARYEAGGASPNGFDCSGFTWYVYQKATGMDIGRSVPEQWNHGNSVGRGSWKPGDIVFFENTFERGLSHDGIYIGGNEFIHAENERTGVVFSILNSGYNSEHYAGARRLL